MTVGVVIALIASVWSLLDIRASLETSLSEYRQKTSDNLSEIRDQITMVRVQNESVVADQRTLSDRVSSIDNQVQEARLNAVTPERLRETLSSEFNAFRLEWFKELADIKRRQDLLDAKMIPPPQK